MACHWIRIVLYKLWIFYWNRNYEPYMFSQDKAITLVKIPLLLLLTFSAYPWCYTKFPGVTGLFEISQRYQGMSTYDASGIWKTQLRHTKMLPIWSKFPWYCIHTKPSILPDVLLNYWGRQCYHPLDAILILPFPFQDHIRQILLPCIA